MCAGLFIARACKILTTDTKELHYVLTINPPRGDVSASFSFVPINKYVAYIFYPQERRAPYCLFKSFIYLIDYELKCNKFRTVKC